MRCGLEGFLGVEGIDKESCGLQVARVFVGNRQRQEPMRGFFPFDYAQGQNDKQKQDDEQNKHRQRQMRGSLHFGRDDGEFGMQRLEWVAR